MNSGGVREPSGRAETAPEDDFGDDWLQAERLSVTTDGRKVSSEGDRTTWTINLKTFTGARSASASKAMIAKLHELDPRFVNGAWPHQMNDGVAVVYGRYESVDDPPRAAGSALDQDVLRQQHTDPPRRDADSSSSAARGSPSGSSSCSRCGSNGRMSIPLYTLQIEVWGNFGTNEISWKEVKRRAEARVRELRAENVLAFYHHDFDQQISMVTVGLFDHTSFDPHSTSGSTPR